MSISPGMPTSWQYLTYDLPSANHPQNVETWQQGLDQLGAEGWEAVSTVTLTRTVNIGGTGPRVAEQTALLLKRPTGQPVQ